MNWKGKAFENLLPERGSTVYIPSFLEPGQSQDLYEILKNQVTWKHESIKMFGRSVLQPRWTALYGDPEVSYTYSGITMKPLPWLTSLSELRHSIEELLGEKFTHVLLNYYRDGQDSMGWHRDNESSLGQNPTIASISLGASREFQMRSIHDKGEKLTVVLESGSLLVMGGESQHHWEHQLPKRKKIEGGRINLTFRKILSTKK